MDEVEDEWQHSMYVLNMSQIEMASDKFLLGKVLLIYQWVTFTVVCQAIDVFGITANIINVVCFIKQGFKDPVNVSLLAMSVADLGALSTLVWSNICMTPSFITSNLPFDVLEVQYATSAVPHTTFTRITSWITAFITMERCLCITAPLKVKNIVTSQRAVIINVSIFIVILVSSAPVYIVNKIGMKFFPERNTTMIGIIYTDERERVEKISFTINNVFIHLIAFVIIIICTVVLVVSLHNKNKWRTQSTSNKQANNLTKLNQKVAKMVVMISSLFIACFTPVCISFLVMVLVPGFAVDGQYRYIIVLIGGIFIVLESINSSVNIFFYYRMSSRYRTVFQQVFSKRFENHKLKRDVPYIGINI